METNNEPTQSEAQTESSAAALRNNTVDVVGRLAARGIDVSTDEHPDNLVRLLDAVEAFEAAVQRQGGDLMVDEPVGASGVSQPDEKAFELPRKRDDESIGEYMTRLKRATTVAQALRD